MNGEPTNAGFLALQNFYGYGAIVIGSLLVWAFISLGSMLSRRAEAEEKRRREAMRDQLRPKS